MASPSAKKSPPAAARSAERPTYSRRRARESALQILFGMDWEVRDPDVAVDDYWAKFAGEKPESYDEVRTHCGELVRGVLGNRAMLDKRISAASHHWKLDRMSAVDRNILRLAVFELLLQGDQVPRKVAINEAIEIAKKFGNEDSSSFVNGILDRIAGELGRDPRPESPRPRGKGKDGREGKDSKDGKDSKPAPRRADTASAEGEA